MVEKNKNGLTSGVSKAGVEIMSPNGDTLFIPNTVVELLFDEKLAKKLSRHGDYTIGDEVFDAILAVYARGYRKEV